MGKVGRRVPRRTGTQTLSEPEVKTLFSYITRLDEEALLRLAIATGIRRDDIVSIGLANVTIEEGFTLIDFWERKKKRYWTVRFGGEAAQRLTQHIDKLPKDTPWLFPSPRSSKNHVSSRTAYNILQRWLARAGIKKRPFHALRGTCVKLAQKHGWSIEQVMELTGDSFRTIKEHYDTPTAEEMVEAAKERPFV